VPEREVLLLEEEKKEKKEKEEGKKEKKEKEEMRMASTYMSPRCNCTSSSCACWPFFFWAIFSISSSTMALGATTITFDPQIISQLFDLF
jgi:hypothetical protein